MVLPVSVLTKICMASALSGYSNKKLNETRTGSRYAPNGEDLSLATPSG